MLLIFLYRLQTLNEALTSGDREKAREAFLQEVKIFNLVEGMALLKLFI